MSTSTMAGSVCWNCGKQVSEELGKHGQACGPCEMEIQSREPPPVLRGMREVMAGRPARTEEERLLSEVRQKNPREFLRMLKEAEGEYNRHMEALQRPVGKSDTVSDLEPDDTEQELDGLTAELLKEWSDV